MRYQIQRLFLAVLVLLYVPASVIGCGCDRTATCRKLPTGGAGGEDAGGAGGSGGEGDMSGGGGGMAGAGGEGGSGGK